jgi:hypothetical protein
MKKDAFQALVRRILTEELVKKNPEMNANGIDPDRKKVRTFKSDDNSRDTKTKEELLDALTKAVHAVNSSYTVVWDDHDDLAINGRDMVNVIIMPQYEDNYRITFYNRNEERSVFNGCSWHQVLEFVKDNLAEKHHHTGVEKARDKSWRNTEDQTSAPDKGLNQDDKPKQKPLTNEKPSEAKNKEKDYTEEPKIDKKDEPNAPYKDAVEFESQRSHKVKAPVKTTTKGYTKPVSTRAKSPAI